MLVKHVDGFIAPRRGPGRERDLVRRVARDAVSGAVDPYFARALDPAIGCWIVRGHAAARIARLLETGRTHGTEVAQAGRPAPRPS